MDQFEQAGIDLTPEAKERIKQAIANFNLSVETVIDCLRDLHTHQELTAMNLSALNLRPQDVTVRNLPKTSSKGHWRDVIPRKQK